MKYKIIKNLAIIGMVFTILLSIYFLGNFAVSIYSFIITSKILLSVFSLLLCFVFVITFRIFQITKSWCKYNIIETRNELFYKKHPTALDKIKSMYPDNTEKWKSYARGEFRENNGIYIYNEKLEKYNVENRIEREVPLSNMLKDFLLVDPFSKPYYRKDTFPNHRSYEEYLQDMSEEATELEALRRN